jgi:hypothetical protein
MRFSHFGHPLLKFQNFPDTEDPRRSGSAEGGENFMIISKELRMSLQAQCEVEDQTVWMTTAQAGFPTTSAEGELDNDLDRQWGKPTIRCLHPAISVYILQRQQELSMLDLSPSMTENRDLELENEWDTQETDREDSDWGTDADEDTTWEPNPLPLMTKHHQESRHPTRRYHQTGRGSLARLVRRERTI